jgi:putative transposase
MKTRQYTEKQIIAVLKEGDADAKIVDLCRKYGMSYATYYNWKARSMAFWCVSLPLS